MLFTVCNGRRDERTDNHRETEKRWPIGLGVYDRGRPRLCGIPAWSVLILQRAGFEFMAAVNPGYFDGASAGGHCLRVSGEITAEFKGRPATGLRVTSRDTLHQQELIQQRTMPLEDREECLFVSFTVMFVGTICFFYCGGWGLVVVEQLVGVATQPRPAS